VSEQRVRLVALNGLLGYGYPRASLDAALAMEPDLIGVDAGSTDPGPFYLGAGESFVSDAQVRSDLEPALCAAVRRGLPLVIGTAGGAGAGPHLDGLVAMVREIAATNALRFRMAVIPAEVAEETVLAALREGRIAPCGPVHALTEEDVRSCTRIVGQMGAGPLTAALGGGAEVVVAGRCCDAAIFAAEPIRRGFDAGLALHMGKILECGTLAARPAGANDVLVGTICEESFEVIPANPDRRCTPESVAGHSLYEQPDPNCFYEPEGKVDLSECQFEQVGERAVRVTGSRLVAAKDETVKLEGARRCGFRAITVAGVRDPLVIERLGEIERSVRAAVSDAMAGTLAADEFRVRFLRFGIDAVTGSLEAPPDPLPREVGLVIDAIAPTQAQADRVLKLARATALHQHFDGRKTTAGNLAFPFSPSDFSGGPVYEFAVYHLMRAEDAGALFPVSFEEVG
jgi:hypothetical protein